MGLYVIILVLAGVLFLFATLLFLRGIVRKNLPVFIWSIALLLAAAGIGLYGAFGITIERAVARRAATKFVPPIIAPHAAASEYVSYTADPKKQDLKLYWKDDTGGVYRSIQRLKDHLATRHKRLVFAMNGGMYKTDNSPLGLYIQEGKQLARLNTADAKSNFYMKPNGVFYITKNKEAHICVTEAFENNGDVLYATQSGPMLLVNGAIHKAFALSSQNRNVRNGVGILPDGRALFAMSRGLVTFYEFATYFKQQGCVDALYLDGFVSRTYLPEQNCKQADGDFGVIIASAVAQ